MLHGRMPDCNRAGNRYIEQNSELKEGVLVAGGWKVIKVELGFSVLIHRNTALSSREVEGDIMLYHSSADGMAVVVGLFRR
jgi:hypothetical protein